MSADLASCFPQAASGLPDPREDHVVVVAKFAMDCLAVMSQVTERLVLELGPDTKDLKLRIGLHSGPVVAGVLRGDKSRFQLFGDTMNTASRMESTGVPNKVQVSQETADLLTAEGKGNWLTQRKEPVIAKGKGELVTYFLSSHVDAARRFPPQEVNAGAVEAEAFDRITDWTAEVMSGLLKEIVTSRKNAGTPRASRENLRVLERKVSLNSQAGKRTVIDEVQEIIELPDFHTKKTKTRKVCVVPLDQQVLQELRNYIRTIALLYNDNRKYSSDSKMHTMSRCGRCF